MAASSLSTPLAVTPAGDIHRPVHAVLSAEPRSGGGVSGSSGRPKLLSSRQITCLAHSRDGHLMAVGTSQHEILILDAARPQEPCGPLARFFTRGAVTSLAFGQGLETWQHTGKEAVRDCWQFHVVCSSLPSVVQKQEERAGDEDRLGVVGDKQGCVGQLVVGDTTGSFYVLILQDVAQKAEALRHVELQAWGGRLKVELASAAEVEVDDTVAVDPDAKQPEEAVVVEAPIEKVNYNELLNRTLLLHKTAVCTLTHDVSGQATCWRFRTVTSRNEWWCRIAWTQASRQTWTWHEQRCPSLASMWSTWGSSNTSPTASAVCFLSGTWHREN